MKEVDDIFAVFRSTGRKGFVSGSSLILSGTIHVSCQVSTFWCTEKRGYNSKQINLKLSATQKRNKLEDWIHSSLQAYWSASFLHDQRLTEQRIDRVQLCSLLDVWAWIQRAAIAMVSVLCGFITGALLLDLRRRSVDSLARLSESSKVLQVPIEPNTLSAPRADPSLTKPNWVAGLLDVRRVRVASRLFV